MSPYTIKCFRASKRYDVEVIGVDSSPDALGRYFADAFEQVPPGDAPDYVDRLIGVAERYEANIILPCSDEEAIALSSAVARVEKGGCKLACPSTDAVAVMHDKLATLEFLKRIGVAHPECWVARSQSELQSHLMNFRLRYRNIAVKPTRSRGSRSVYVLDSCRTVIDQPAGHREVYVNYDVFERDLLPTFDWSSPWLVTEGLVAPAYDLDVLARGGEALQVIPRRRVNPAGIPFRGSVLVNNNTLVEIASRIARGLNTKWLFDIDVMSDDKGQPKVIEINPRPSGSLSAAVAAGIPILDNLISLAVGADIEHVPIPNELAALPYTSIEMI